MNKIRHVEPVLTNYQDILCLGDDDYQDNLRRVLIRSLQDHSVTSHALLTSFSKTPILDELPCPYRADEGPLHKSICVGGCMLNLGNGFCLPVVLFQDSTRLNALVLNTPLHYLYKMLQKPVERSPMEQVVHGNAFSKIVDARMKHENLNYDVSSNKSAIRPLASIVPYLFRPENIAQMWALYSILPRTSVPTEAKLTLGRVEFNTTSQFPPPEAFEAFETDTDFVVNTCQKSFQYIINTSLNYKLNHSLQAHIPHHPFPIPSLIYWPFDGMKTCKTVLYECDIQKTYDKMTLPGSVIVVLQDDTHNFFVHGTDLGGKTYGLDDLLYQLNFDPPEFVIIAHFRSKRVVNVEQVVNSVKKARYEQSDRSSNPGKDLANLLMGTVS